MNSTHEIRFVNKNVSPLELTFSIANLSDIIYDIEYVTKYDLFQVFLESVVALTCIVGNILTVIVLRHVAFTHPTQALRFTLAIIDLLVGVFGSAVSLLYHSYYLWCASDKQNCQYEVNVVRFAGNENFYIVYTGLTTLFHFIHWVSIWVGIFLIAVMAAERCFAICRPFRHKCLVTIRFIQKTIIGIIMYVILHVLTFRLLENKYYKGIIWMTRHSKFHKKRKFIESHSHITNINQLMEFCGVITLMITTSTLAVITLLKLKTLNKSREVLTNKT